LIGIYISVLAGNIFVPMMSYEIYEYHSGYLRDYFNWNILILEVRANMHTDI